MDPYGDRHRSLTTHNYATKEKSQSHTKENEKRHNNNNNKHKGGVEIVDFRDSWLKEVERYERQISAQKQQRLSLHNNHDQQHYTLRTTGERGGGTGFHGTLAQNYLFGGDDDFKQDMEELKRQAAEEPQNKKHAATRSKFNSSPPKSSYSPTKGSSNPNKASNSTTKGSSSPTKTQQNGNVQLILKRPREATTEPNKAAAAATTSPQAKRKLRAKTRPPATASSEKANNQSPKAQHRKSPAKSASPAKNSLKTKEASPEATGVSPPTSPPLVRGRAFLKKNVKTNATKLPAAVEHTGGSNFVWQVAANASPAAPPSPTSPSPPADKNLPNKNAKSLSAGTHRNHMLQSSNNNAPKKPNLTGLKPKTVQLTWHDRNNFISIPSEKTINRCNAWNEDKSNRALIESSKDDSPGIYKGMPFYILPDVQITLQSAHIRHPEEHVTTINSDERAKAGVEYYTPGCILSPSLFPNVPPYLNFASHVATPPEMPAMLHKVLKWKLSPVMPKIVKRVVLNSGFRIIKNTTDWMAVWEKHMKSPGFRTIRSHQKYNHMPGSFRIGRKDTMWKCLHINMLKYGPREFGFMQETYILPEDLETLRQNWSENASNLTKWIIKPPASARGTGIRIVNQWSQFPKDRPLVVQRYVERPLLINESKFDLRLYVLMTSINPLRLFMYKDGLARFAAVKYRAGLNNLEDRCMHLTNYSINKFSENYAKNEDFQACQGHKWTLQSLWTCLEKRGVSTNRLWATLRNLVVKAVISGESGLNRTYRQHVNSRYNCFELFGFDVLLDEDLVPWLLEINISPSLHSELPLDLHVKGPLIQAVLNTALYQVPPKLNDKHQREIKEELKLHGPLCYDKRLYTTCLTADEVRKHNQFTNRTIDFREEYVEHILENLLPDDVRCLIIAEDEFARCTPLERIFPTADTHVFLHFFDNPRYYNRLLDAWERKYELNRAEGRDRLRALCADGYHLQVAEAAMEDEPNVAVTEIDLLHMKPADGQTNASNAASHAVNGTTTNTTTADNTLDNFVPSMSSEAKV